jgi:sarcosine oxidase subunit beta
MMWGPAVARAAADVALTGASDVVDVADLGLDRFDADGNSKLATDPIALPFPAAAPPPAGASAPASSPGRETPGRLTLS